LQKNAQLVEIQEEKLTTIENQLLQMQNSLTKITDCLLGNEFNKQKGLVSDVNDQEERLSRLEKMEDRAKVFIVAASIFSGYGLFELANRIIEAIAK
jgi:hypothetical protein